MAGDGHALLVHETSHAWKRLCLQRGCGLALGFALRAVGAHAPIVGPATELARLTARRSTAARSAVVDLVAWRTTRFRTWEHQASSFGRPSPTRTDLAELPKLDAGSGVHAAA